MKVVSTTFIRNILVSLTLFLDLFKELNVQFLSFLKSLLFYFNARKIGAFSSYLTLRGVVRGDDSHSLSSKTWFVDTSNTRGVYFLKFKN